MTYLLIGGAALLAVLAAYQYMRQADPSLVRQGLRWGLGGALGLVTLALAIFRRLDLAVFTGAAALQVLRFGRLGPWSLDRVAGESHNTSRIRSRYFDMTLDHDTGAVEGRVLAGRFAGADLIGLGEAETRALIEEIAWDPDSVSLLESWLDANRAGWREYFEETSRNDAPGAGEPAAGDPIAEAYSVLGLAPGATAEDIRAAHRDLMKAVHPDHGGSSYLASKINEARDRLLRHIGSH